MDRREREVLQWLNRQLYALGVDKRFDRLPNGNPHDEMLYPATRVLGAALAKKHGPQTAFRAWLNRYEYWTPLARRDEWFPPVVIEFNVAFGMGMYPHLDATIGQQKLPV